PGRSRSASRRSVLPRPYRAGLRRGRRRTAKQLRSSYRLPPALLALAASRGPDLAALLDEYDVVVAAIAVDEVPEAPERNGIFDGLLPLALVRGDHVRHVLLEIRSDAELVLDHDFAQVVDAALQILQPHGSALQAIGSTDI